MRVYQWKLGNMPLDEKVQAKMYNAAMMMPSNNSFLRLVFFRLIYMSAVIFILSDFVSDFYVAGMFSQNLEPDNTGKIK